MTMQPLNRNIPAMQQTTQVAGNSLKNPALLVREEVAHKFIKDVQKLPCGSTAMRVDGAERRSGIGATVKPGARRLFGKLLDTEGIASRFLAPFRRFISYCRGEPKRMDPDVAAEHDRSVDAIAAKLFPKTNLGALVSKPPNAVTVESTYEGLDKATETALKSKCDEAGKKENAPLNRYTNILAPDKSLHMPGLTNSPTYINASKVTPNPASGKTYVATQGPTEKTIGRFFEMLVAGGTRTIVNTTKAVEGIRAKCHDYWTKEGEVTKLEGGGQVIRKEAQAVFVDGKRVGAKYTFEFRNKDGSPMKYPEGMVIDGKPVGGKEIPNVTLFHYEEWPDHGVPENPEHLVEFLKAVNTHEESCGTDRGPPVFHCSAGIGRTGTALIGYAQFVEIKDQLKALGQKVTPTALEKIELTTPEQMMVNLREGRPGMVQTAEQFVFAHSMSMRLAVQVQTAHTTFAKSKVELKELPKATVAPQPAPTQQAPAAAAQSPRPVEATRQKLTPEVGALFEEISQVYRSNVRSSFTGEQAEQQLANAPLGHFFIRPGSTPGTVAVSFKTDKGVVHLQYKHATANRWIHGDRTGGNETAFQNVQEFADLLRFEATKFARPAQPQSAPAGAAQSPGVQASTPKTETTKEALLKDIQAADQGLKVFDLDRPKAEKQLQGDPPGTFILRLGSEPETVVASIRTSNGFRHVKFKRDESGSWIDVMRESGDTTVYKDATALISNIRDSAKGYASAGATQSRVPRDSAQGAVLQDLKTEIQKDKSIRYVPGADRNTAETLLQRSTDFPCLVYPDKSTPGAVVASFRTSTGIEHRQFIRDAQGHWIDSNRPAGDTTTFRDAAALVQHLKQLSGGSK